MSLAIDRQACVLLVVGACLCAQAQVTATPVETPAAQPEKLEQVPRVPGVGTLFRGFNAGIAYSGVHSSAIGWYSVLTPAVSYSFSRHYSADINASIYFQHLVETQIPRAAPGDFESSNENAPGDTLFGFHAAFNPSIFDYTATVYVSAPTGDTSAGLGAGKATFDFSNHAVHYVHQVGLLVDLGVGDSSSLFNSLVVRDSTSLGNLAHFQAGAIFWLPGRSYIQSTAYEQLPFGSQTVYTTLSPPGAPVRTATSISGVSEDNGETTSVAIPLTDHCTLSGYYNRSFRQHTDTVSVGLTYVLRGTPRRKGLSMIDRALREAESPSQ